MPLLAGRPPRHTVAAAALGSLALLGCSDVDTTVGLAIESGRARQAESAAAVTGAPGPETPSAGMPSAGTPGAGGLAVPERRAPAGADERAVAEAVRLVYDPAAPFAAAARHLAEPALVEASRQTLAAVLAGVGSFRTSVGDVRIEGGRARFVLDVHAGGRAVQVGLAGEARRAGEDGPWQLTTATFCGALASLPLLVCP